MHIDKSGLSVQVAALSERQVRSVNARAFTGDVDVLSITVCKSTNPSCRYKSQHFSSDRCTLLRECVCTTNAVTTLPYGRWAGVANGYSTT